MTKIGASERCGHMLALVPFCLRAIVELARARMHHMSLKPRDILALNSAAANGDPRLAPPRSSAYIARVAFVIPRIAARLPWRADCLVQALAAQHWLKRQGIPSQISIGVDRDVDGEFAAHAWLTHDGQIVTGGEISRYSPLLIPQNGD